MVGTAIQSCRNTVNNSPSIDVPSTTDNGTIDPVISIMAVQANTAPVLNIAASPALPAAAVGKLPVGAVGSAVAALLGTAATDAEQSVLGMAVTGVAAGRTLYYSLDDGVTWTALTGTVSAGSALLLDANARVYVAAGSTFTGTINDALSFKAWDLTEGANGDIGANTLSGTYVVGEVTLGSSGIRRGSEMEISGQYAYVADGTSGLQIVDISSPAAPVARGVYDTANQAVAVKIVGNYAYVADGYMQTGLTIVDIGDPDAPMLLGSLATSLYPSYIAVQGDYAYLAGNGGAMQIVNIANPAAPQSVHFLSGVAAVSIAAVGDYVYLGQRAGGINIVDVTNPASPVMGSSVSLSGEVTDILIEKGIAYVATTSQLTILDVQDPAAPVVLHTMSAGMSASDLAKDGKYLYVATYTSGVMKFDVSAPDAPTLMASFDTKFVGNVSVLDDVVFTANAGKVIGYGFRESTAFSSTIDTVSASIAPLHPVLQLDAGAQTFVENSTAVSVSPGLVLTDVNSTKIGQVAVYLKSNTAIVIGGGPLNDVTAAESLVFVANADTGDIAGAYSAEEGLSLTSLSGNATLAQWQAALRQVAYLNTSDAPVASRAVSFIVVDADNEGFTEVARLVNITAVNDAPTISGVPAGATQIQLGTATALTSISVADLDSTALTLTITATSGTVDGLVDADPLAEGIQLAGTAAQINQALSGAKFTMSAAGEGSLALSLRDDTVVAPTTATYQFVASTPATPVPATPTTPIDGVPVQIGTGADGQQQIVVPVITGGRQEDISTPNGKLADIPVVKGADGQALLNIGVPVGTGLTAQGPATLVSGNTAQSALDGGITAAGGSAEQKAVGLNFLNSLASGTQVVVQTIKPTAQGDGGPLVISAANAADGHKTAVVIDTSALPAGTVIDLENVDFALVVGNARVTGGAGANTVYGDDGKQFIVLGEGDDILHGGGNDDTVGSLRGNDQTFGDAGNDMVYGGTGNDSLHGGSGNDRMNGGFGLDTAVQSGVAADYSVTVDGRAVVLTHKVSGEVDRFLDVEHITFDSGTSLIVAHTAGDVAGLTAQFTGAQLIELNANRAVGGTAASDDITPELGMALNIDLGAGVDIVRLAGARADVHIDVEAGQRAELTQLADGAMLAFNNVELLAFANGNVTVLAHNHQEAVVGRAYELLLDRNVDTGGFAFWIAGVQSGVSLKDTLSLMMHSPEYTGASLSNGAFVDLLYTNGFGRAADAEGKAFWVGALDTGVSRAQVLEGFASSAEAVTVIGSTIDVTVVS
jgi:hypothetical protein